MRVMDPVCRPDVSHLGGRGNGTLPERKEDGRGDLAGAISVVVPIR